MSKESVGEICDALLDHWENADCTCDLDVGWVCERCFYMQSIREIKKKNAETEKRCRELEKEVKRLDWRD